MMLTEFLNAVLKLQNIDSGQLFSQKTDTDLICYGIKKKKSSKTSNLISDADAKEFHPLVVLPGSTIICRILLGTRCSSRLFSFPAF